MMIDIKSFVELRHQAAGHLGPLNNEDGSLFTKLTTQQEIDFYNLQQLDDDEDEEGRDLGTKFKDWMPKYLGILESGITKELEATGKVDDEWKLRLANQQQEEEQEQQNKKNDDSLMTTSSSSSSSLEKKNNNNKKYILLENLLHGFKKPSIMDIKLGSKLYDEKLDDAKKDRMKKVSETTTSGSLGYRICGMKFIPKSDNNDIDDDELLNFDPNFFSKDEEYIMLNKEFGRSLNKDNIKQGFKNFFQNNDLPIDVQQDLLEIFHIRLQIFYNCLLDSKIELISTSLFFVFENDLSKWENDKLNDELIYEYMISEEEEDEEEEEEEEEPEVEKLSSMNVIDFAHATESKTVDERVIEGVANLIQVIESMMM